MRYKILALVVLAFFLAFTSVVSEAAVPHLLRYQGTLTDANNVPLNGSYNLTFRVYNAATAGTLLWSETQTAVSVSDGVFSVLLGSVTALNLAFDADYWLSTEVGTSGEMSPRQRITSVGYAIRAETAENLANPPAPPAPPQAAQAVGVTVSPTTSSGTYVDLPDMSITMTTGANPVLVIFSSSIQADTAGKVTNVIVEIDGVLKNESERKIDQITGGYAYVIGTSWLETMTAGNHTFKIKWKIEGGGTVVANQTKRSMQVIEFK